MGTRVNKDSMFQATYCFPALYTSSNERRNSTTSWQCRACSCSDVFPQPETHIQVTKTNERDTRCSPVKTTKSCNNFVVTVVLPDLLLSHFLALIFTTGDEPHLSPNFLFIYVAINGGVQAQFKLTPFAKGSFMWHIAVYSR